MAQKHWLLAATAMAIIGVLASYTIVHAQVEPETVHVRGKVLDQNTSAPIPGAVVEVPGLEIRAATDSLGNFRLDLPMGPGYRLTAEQLGYLSSGVPVYAADYHLPVVISLAPDPVILEGLRVTVDRFRTRRNSARSAVQTIDAEALEDFAGRNMFAVLRFRVPFLRRCSESGFQYCVPRRGRTSRVRVCIDEFPMAAGVDMLGSYPPEYFHLIELYDRGTMIRAYSKRFVARLAKHPRRLDPLGVRC